MKLIVWLWNPWNQYVRTRHNAGFLILDELVERHCWTQFLNQEKFGSLMATGMIGSTQCIFLKPMLYMNKSWWPVQKVMNYYKIPSEHVLVVHDDIDIPVSALKLKFNGSHGWHNGIRDIYARTWSDRFWKLKWWVGRPGWKWEVIDYVLGKMSEDEYAELVADWKSIDQRVEQFLKNSG